MSQTLAPDGTPWVASELYRASRLSRSDDFFRERVTFAAQIAGTTPSEELTRSVAMAVVSFVQVSEAGTVDSSAVTDEEITAAVTAWIAAQPEVTA